MRSTRRSSNTRQRILEAARQLVLRDGVARLTLERVAREAGVSKGGVLYYFPTKEALVRGMVEALITDFERDMAAYAERDPEPAGRRMRAFLAAVFAESRKVRRAKRLAAPLLAAFMSNPRLLDPLRRRHRKAERSLKAEGIDPARAAIVNLAADGLWMNELFGFPSLRRDLRARVLDELRRLTRPQDA